MARFGYKWGMYRIFGRVPVLASSLPETRLWGKHNLVEMINRYGSVIVKPSNGSRGAGIIKVTKKSNERFEVHLMAKRSLVTGIEATYSFIRKLVHPSYLIQQRIPLAEIGGRPMDIRVIVQRHHNGDPWTVTGYVAKIAGAGHIVTNVTRSRGYVLPVREAIAKSTAKDAPTERVVKHLFGYCVVAAERLSVYSPGSNVFGFDMGVDHRGKVWMIEVNGKPSLSHFLKLKNKRMYWKIRSYGYNPQFT